MAHGCRVSRCWCCCFLPSSRVSSIPTGPTHRLHARSASRWSQLPVQSDLDGRLGIAECRNAAVHALIRVLHKWREAACAEQDRLRDPQRRSPPIFVGAFGEDRVAFRERPARSGDLGRDFYPVSRIEPAEEHQTVGVVAFEPGLHLPDFAAGRDADDATVSDPVPTPTCDREAPDGRPRRKASRSSAAP